MPERPVTYRIMEPTPAQLRAERDHYRIAAEAAYRQLSNMHPRNTDSANREFVNRAMDVLREALRDA